MANRVPASGFFRALQDFSHAFRTGSPQLPAQAHRLLEMTYENDELYCSPSLNESLNKAGEDGTAFTVFDWAFMDQNVLPAIAGQGAETAQAFRELLTACKRTNWQRSKGGRPALS